jgi:phosphoribosylformylglycinamidine synthase subunit PurL
MNRDTDSGQADTWWREEASVEEALEHGLTAEEFRNVTELLGRPLSLLETGIFSALYSEHCSYKSSKIHLKTLPTQGERVIHGPGENAGVIDIGDNKAVVFKIESHNHPSFIEPFQGAATGVGGILRDVFTMGARPIALMNALRFGTKDVPRTPYLVKRCVSGIGTYGNSVGVPTVGGELFFHESYNGNCLVNAFALGVVDHDKIFLGQAAGIGNSILYVGSKTGRDGIHGATMASESFGESAEEKRPTVQVGDPFQEKLLIEACLEAMNSGHIVGIQDMGAAGMTSSSFEMADRAGNGVRLDLDKVPQREEGMNPYEIMLSESQERMLVVVSAGKEAKVCEIFQKWGLDAVNIGEVEKGNEVRLFWHGKLVSSIPAQLVTSSVPQYRWPTEQPGDFESRLAFDVSVVAEPEDLDAVWLKILGDVNVASRSPVYDQYDSTVRCNTVVHPGGDAAVVRVKSGKRVGKFNREKGIALTLDCNSRYCSIDPRQGTALSVAESYRNIIAVGAEPIGISNCLNFGSPERPTAMWQFAEAVKGLGDAARAFDVPVVSGNVSLYNETKGKAIYPTPQIAMVGLIEDASLAIGSHFQDDGDVVFVIGETRKEDLGGTEYVAIIAGVEKGRLPNLNYDLEITTGNVIRDLIHKRLLQSCHDISSGGLGVALAESCFAPKGLRGVCLVAEEYEGRLDALLFAETGARYIVSCKADVADSVRSSLEDAGLTIGLSGAVGGGDIAIEDVAAINVQSAFDSWSKGLENHIFQNESSAVAADKPGKGSVEAVA